jgi:hypothetical protein
MTKDPSQPDEEKEDEVIPVTEKKKRKLSPSTEKTKAQSEARNSYLRLVIVLVLAVGIVLSLMMDLLAYYILWWNLGEVRPVYTGFVKDILLVISSFGAYLLGKGSMDKKDDD